MRDGEMSVTATIKAPDRPVLNRLAGAVRVNEAQKMTWLRIFLRVVSLGYLAAFIPWITLILLDAPVLAPGGSFAPMLRFQPYNADYESMLTAINLVWAVMLWRASDEPAGHPLFIDFTIWASAAHGLVMLIATPIQKGLPMTFVEGLPLFFVASVLLWLRPSGSLRGAPVSVLRRGTRKRAERTLPTRRISAQAGVSERTGAAGKAWVRRGRRLPRVPLQAFSSITSCP